MKKTKSSSFKMIPILDLKKEYAFLNKDIRQQLSECFKSQHWILGSKVQEFQKRVASLLKVKFCRGVASGTDALVIALRALAMQRTGRDYFKESDEIITTPFTFVATAEAIIRSGARCVFVDIDPDTFNIDPEAVKRAVTKKTVGILPVHLYGQSCRIDALSKIAGENNLFLLEDCAQSFSAEYNSKKVGSFGDCGAFSFFPSKVLGCFGDGGCITTNDAKLCEYVEVLRSHGQKNYADAVCVGYNSRLDEMQAAILIAKLQYINKFIALRRAAALDYNKSFNGAQFVQTPLTDKNCLHSYGLYTIKAAKKRDELVSTLNRQGIGARVYYHKPLHKMSAFKKSKVAGSMPGLGEVIDKVISLPLHPFLKKPQIKMIVKAIKTFYGET
jgi:UDP-2-acetamido-2-deoxy-ribo-hexuluronate aminotransferase